MKLAGGFWGKPIKFAFLTGVIWGMGFCLALSAQEREPVSPEPANSMGREAAPPAEQTEIKRVPKRESGRKPAEQSVASDGEDADEREQVFDTIRYGIDSELLEVIQRLVEDAVSVESEDSGSEFGQIEETPYNEPLYQRIVQGFSSVELLTESFHFFIKQRWAGAEDYAVELLEQENLTGEVDDTVMKACLDYFRYLGLKAHEGKVLMMLRSENPRLVVQTLLALAKIGSEETGEALLGLLQDSRSSFMSFSKPEQEFLRIKSIEALGAIGYKPASDFLFELWQDDGLSNTEWGALARTMGELGRTGAEEEIMKAFRKGDLQRRFQVISALSAYSDVSQFSSLIVQGLQESFWRTRVEACKAVGEYKLVEMIPSLEYRLSKDSIVSVRNEALTALDKMGPAGVVAIRKVISDPDVAENIRLGLLQRLVQKRRPFVADILRNLVKERKESEEFSLESIYNIAVTNPWDLLSFIYKDMLENPETKWVLKALHAIPKGKISELRPMVEKIAQNGSTGSLRSAAEKAVKILDES